MRLANPADFVSKAPYLLYHGGRYRSGPVEVRPSRTKRAEHGPGFYLTTSGTTARRYARGGGIVHIFELARDTVFLEDTFLPASELIAFVEHRPKLRHRADIVADLQANTSRTGRLVIPAATLLNLMVNYDVLRGEHGPALARFYVQHGIDASRDRRSGEDWVVVFNPWKLTNAYRPRPDQIKELPPLDRQ